MACGLPRSPGQGPVVRARDEPGAPGTRRRYGPRCRLPGSACLDVFRAVCRPRDEVVLENLALRQQVAALLRQRPRPQLDDVDRAFWIALRRSGPQWVNALLIVKADTLARWHRERFRRHWANLCRRPGRPRICTEIRGLIREMATHGRGAPRIHGELLELGFDVAEATVWRYMPRRPVEPDQLARWIAFLRNYKEAIAAMDFFTLPTLSLRVLYGLFIIDHGRRRIVHFNATCNPTAQWVIQQLREAFPFDTAPAHLIFDRDAIFSAAVVRFVQALAASPRRIAYRSPWQNPVAERWIGSCRRERTCRRGLPRMEFRRARRPCYDASH